jgi:hypothetical protein
LNTPAPERETINRNMSKKRTHTTDSVENVEPKLQKLVPNSVSILGLSKQNASICNINALSTRLIPIESHQMKKKRLKAEAMKLSRKESTRRSTEKSKDSVAKGQHRKLNLYAERQRVKQAKANAR